MTPSPRARTRFPVMALGMLALLAALWGGLTRLGWALPGGGTLAAYHGPLMVSGFLGTVIGLERAVAVARAWAYGGPLLTGLGAVALMAGVPGAPGPLCMTLGSLVLVAVFVVVIRRQLEPFTLTMAAGALVWLVGNVLWLLGYPVPLVVPWWTGFLVLTIAGERLELTRVLRLSRGSRTAFVVAGALVLSGAVVSAATFDPGVRLAGVGFCGLALWLARYDVARRTVRQAGLTRFVAICLLSGYAWLGIAGLLALRFGGVTAGPGYDAFLHALFLGFVFAMILGHAPLVFPAVLEVSMVFRPTFYVPLALLHATLAVRVIGDLAVWLPGRQWGGLLNVLALLSFLANTAFAIARPAPTPRPGI